MSACLRFTRRVWKSFVDNRGHDSTCFPNLRIEKAIPGLVHASLKIEDYNLNRVKTVHGGLICSLTDTLGSLAVASKGHFMTGVSTEIGTSFVKAAGTTGDTLYAKAAVVALGRSLAYTRIDFTNAAGQLIAFGRTLRQTINTSDIKNLLDHTKFVGKSHDNPKNVKFSEDGEKVIEGEDLEA